MNKVNWVDGRYTTPGDFNAMQSAPEDHLRSQAKSSLAGLVDGMTLTGTSDGVQVGPGVAWDNQGRRIMVPAATPVDVSAIQRPASGRFKWVAIFATYRRVERATVTDATGVNHAAYFDDGYALAAASGPEFTSAVSAPSDGLGGPTQLDRLRAAGSWSPTGSQPNYPATPPGAVRIGAFAIDHDSGWVDMVVNHARIFYSPGIVMISSGATSDIDAAIRSILASGEVAYAWGGVSAPAPDSLSDAPVLLVENKTVAYIVAVKNGAPHRVRADTVGIKAQVVVLMP